MQGKRRIGSHLPARDRRTEAELLGAVDRAAPLPIGYGFGAAVVGRLDRGDRERGNEFAGRPVAELLAEAEEEAEDLAAWSVLAYVRAVAVGADQSSLDALREPVVAAGFHAARAHYELRRAAAAWKAAER